MLPSPMEMSFASFTLRASPSLTTPMLLADVNSVAPPRILRVSLFFLGDRRISRRIVTGELQVYFTVFTNNVVSRSNLIDFKLFIVVSGNWSAYFHPASSG